MIYDTAGKLIIEPIINCPRECGITGGCEICNPIPQSIKDEYEFKRQESISKEIYEREHLSREEEDRFYKKVMKTELL